MKWLYYIPALLADWANGIFAVLLASAITGLDASWWYFLIGMCLAHSPDLDALPELVRRGRVAASAEHPEDHRTFGHYPVFVLPVLLLLAAVDPYWGTVWFIVVVLHYVNDFYGAGWGLPLLFPFSRRQYKFLGRRANRLRRILVAQGDWDRLSVAERRLRPVVSWSAAELTPYIMQWGMERWVREYYFRWNWIMATEYTLFVVAVVMMVEYLL